MAGNSAKFGQGAAFKAKWISKTANGNFIRNVDSIVDEAQLNLQSIKIGGTLANDELLKILKKRQLITTSKSTTYSVEKGLQFTTDIKVKQTDITMDMLAR